MTSKKVCFLTIRNIFNTSCLPRYANLLNGEFDIIYWDQHGIQEDGGARNHYKFEYVVPYGKSRWKKLFGYIKFWFYATKIIKENKYDIIIVLPTQTAVLFYRLLLKRYSGRYILDIRDYTAEKNKLFYNLQKKLIKTSGITVITSPAYKRFLPEHNYVISHNVAKVDQDLVAKYRARDKRDKKMIVISCIGSIRFISQFQRVIKVFGNDDRFELRFIGRGAEYLEEYCIKHSIKNTILKGRFNSYDTVKYYMDTDIVMNLYGNNNLFLDYALSNKLYYAATFGMPILVCPGTYMEEVAVGNGFGFTCDLNDERIGSQLYDYYMSINWGSFYKSCDDFMDNVYKDEKQFKDVVLKYLVSYD